jgi:hypothetical protein
VDNEFITLRAMSSWSTLEVNEPACPSRRLQATSNTFPPVVARLLERHGLTAAADARTLTMNQIDQMLEGLTTAQSIEAKLKLSAAGVRWSR